MRQLRRRRHLRELGRGVCGARVQPPRTVQDSVESTGQKVIDGSEVGGLTNATLNLGFPAAATPG
jgi:hypothetical protein